MNIAMKGAGLLGMGNPGLKSTQDRLDRMAKRDNKIAFFEQQKENLKTMKTDSLEDISRKLEMLHGYDDQIALAKVEFNNSQVFHMLDEARELGEKIAEAAEKNAPKTPEERREDMIEEATGGETRCHSQVGSSVCPPHGDHYPGLQGKQRRYVEFLLT